MHVYEVRSRKDKRGVDLISDVASSIRSQRSTHEHAGDFQKNRKRHAYNKEPPR